MAKNVKIEYKTLLTKAEYERLFKQFNNNTANTQTNYYFDTKRFTLKASDAALRVKERSNLYVTLERKKGYQIIRYDEDITREQFEEMLKTGIVPNEKIQSEIQDLVKDQKLINYLTLSTFRITFPYKNGKVALDKCTYVNTTDYELEYEAPNKEIGKLDFIEIIKEFNIKYQKSQIKLRRAYDALRNNY